MKIKNVIATIGLTLATAAAFTAGIVLANKSSSAKTEAASLGYSQGSVIANDKARIWIGYDTSNPFYSYADANTGIRLWIHSTSAGGTEKNFTTITGTFNNSAESGRRYDYFDVDLDVYTNGWYMTVQKFQNNSWKGQTNPIQLGSSNAFKVYFIWGDWAWDSTAGTVAAGSIDSVDAGLAAKALGGMHSCSSSNINGYNAFPNYNSTFVKNGDDWRTVGNINDYDLSDFVEGDGSYTGSATNVVNAYDKYEFVQSQYNAHQSGTSNPLSIVGATGNNTAFVLVISAVAIASVSGCFFIRKKRLSK